MNRPFADWLRERRKSLDLTQDELAKRVSCSPETIRKIEAGTRQPSRQIAELLAAQLNIAADERADFIQFARNANPAFAPARALPPDNLPNPPTPLIGREMVIADARRRLLADDTHLLTLLGPPGIGKTRLSIAIARSVLEKFAHGVWFVQLAPIADGELVAPAIVSILNLRIEGPQTPRERLKQFLRDKQLLLVLDNFEQILPAAELLADLMAACPLLKILVTSRAPLGLRGERQFPIPPLSLPDAHASLETSASASAIALFLERAEAVQPDFVLTPDNAPAILALCQKVDGLPLAIELIAARVKIFSPAALLERLQSGQMMSANGLRDLDPRHATLNTAIDWSYRLLNVEEQTLFRRLGVFRGGWTLEAANICGESIGDLVALMASLLDKNLIRREGEERFGMLETIRVYALEKLSESGEIWDIRRRHAHFFRTLVEQAEPKLHTSNGAFWFNQLLAEDGNLQSILHEFFNDASEDDNAIWIAAGLWNFWADAGRYQQGINWLEKMLGHIVDAPPALRAKVLHAAAALNTYFDNGSYAVKLYQAALQEARHVDDHWICAHSLAWLGQIAHANDHLLQKALLDESLNLAKLQGDPWLIATSLSCLGKYYRHRSQLELSQAALEEALALVMGLELPHEIGMFTLELGETLASQGNLADAKSIMTDGLISLRQSGNRLIVAHGLGDLGDVERLLHNFDLARTDYEEALTIWREFDNTYREIKLLYKLAYTALHQNLVDEAHLLFHQGLKQAAQLQLLEEVIQWSALALAGLAKVAARTGALPSAVMLMSAADKHFQSIQRTFTQLTPADRNEILSLNKLLHDSLEPSVYMTYWEDGARMSLDEAVRYALRQT